MNDLCWIPVVVQSLISVVLAVYIIKLITTEVGNGKESTSGVQSSAVEDCPSVGCKQEGSGCYTGIGDSRCKQGCEAKEPAFETSEIGHATPLIDREV